jgi:hypothetical protein
MQAYRIRCKVHVIKETETYIIANGKDEAIKRFKDNEGISCEEVISEEVNDVNILDVEEA